jgi:hypothetical protein
MIIYSANKARFLDDILSNVFMEYHIQQSTKRSCLPSNKCTYRTL